MPAATAMLTTLVSVAFALCLLERWVERRKPHELAWAIALGEFAVASLAQWWGATAGWSGLSFRAFYLFGPILSVPALGLGTALLLGSGRRARLWTQVVVIWSWVSVGILAAAPLTAAIDPTALPQGSDVFGPLPRILAAVGSTLGAFVMIGGAIWSATRLARKRSTARLAVANVLIALGAIALSMGGVLNSVADEMTGFAIAHAVGITLVFTGFLATGRTRRPVLRSAQLAA